VNLPKLTGGVFGDTQFKVLCIIASFALTSTVGISCLSIHERAPRLDQTPTSEKPTGFLSFFRQIFRSMRRLPPQIRKVCEVQFFAWIGWFPFLFYTTTYIGQINVNPYFAANPDLTPQQIDDAWESATRVGTFALLIFAITSFTSNMLLPFIIVPTYQSPPRLNAISSLQPSSLSHPHPHQANNAHNHEGMSDTVNAFYFARKSRELQSWLSHILLACQIPWLTLRRAWLLSHLCFALCMLATFFISSVGAAITLVGFIGFSWALTLWAPFALISAEISKRNTESRRLERRNGLRIENEDQAGIILGLHNVAISAPQIFASLVCSAIFKAAQRPRGTAGDESTAWVLRFGGAAALIAAYMTYRVEEEGDINMRGVDVERSGET
jgi:solute carrier family 45, member 1/2/4